MLLAWAWKNRSKAFLIRFGYTPGGDQATLVTPDSLGWERMRYVDYGPQ